MFTLNTPENPDALWQYAVMILISAVIGYILGHIGNKQKERRLEMKLAKLDSEIAAYPLKKDLFTKNDSSVSNQISDNKIVKEIKADNLKVIEGIDSQIEEQLNSAGIHTFQQLSTTGAERLTEILRNSGVPFQMHHPRTWPQQAELAENKMWEDLAELQNELNKEKY